MTTPTTDWPKPFLLQVHQQAVEHGMVWIEPITEADAASLRSRLYRIRRRADKSMMQFIPPEYHLVMVGEWQSGPNRTGRLPVIYNCKADGQQLPAIITASGAEVEAYTAPPALADPPPPELNISNASLAIDEGEIDDLVGRLRKAAAARQRAGDQ